MYYEIGLDMIASGFDYFGGGGLNNTTNGGKAQDLYELAKQAGYKVANDTVAAGALKPSDGKVIGRAARTG